MKLLLLVTLLFVGSVISTNLIVTESLLNGFSEYQSDITGYLPPAFHPTGLIVESVFNPFAIGLQPPNPYPPTPLPPETPLYPGYQNVAGQNTGFCISLTDDGAGEWYCALQFVFYKNNSINCVCIPPNSACDNIQNGCITGTIAYSGIFPSVYPVPFNFTTLTVIGGTGAYQNIVGGSIIATQIPDYSQFTYYITLIP